jgi:hypothetical protein
MIGCVKSYGELAPISLDYSAYAVALFRIKVTTTARVDINDLGALVVRLYSIGYSIKYRDIALKVRSTDGVTFLVAINEFLKNSATDIPCCIKIVDNYAYFYAQACNKYETLSFQILYSVHQGYIETLDSSYTITNAEFQSTTNSYSPTNYVFTTPKVIYNASYCGVSNDSQVDNNSIDEFAYAHITTRVCILKACPAGTILFTCNKLPLNRAVVFFADVQAAYDMTVTPTRVPMNINTSGQVTCKQALVANNNVYIDVRYRF